MSCKLKINDPILSHYLGKDSFESYEDFRNSFENKLMEGYFPLSNRIVGVQKTEQGYNIEGQELTNTDSVVRLSLSNLIDTNNPDIQFSRLIETYNLYLDKYNQEYLSNPEKEQDIDFLKSLIGFYESFPITQEFKDTELFQKYSNTTKETERLIDEIQGSLKIVPELLTNESDLWHTERELPYYIYTLTKLYKKGEQPIYDSEDPLSVLRFKVQQHLSTLDLKNREFFVRLEPDSKDNVQTAIPEDSWRWGVVAVLYERTGNEFKRVYVKNNKGEITTNHKEAKEWGANKSKNFTFTIPRYEERQAYGKINLDARQALLEARGEALKEPSSYYLLEGFYSEYPKGTSLTLDEFIGNSEASLRVATDTNRVFYSGNLFVEFPNGEKAPTNRTPLSKEWKNLVLGLINHQYDDPVETERVVGFLNKLLSYKGGDVHFFNRKGKIVAYRYSKKVEGKFQRVSEETPKSDVPELLDYARINLDKRLLEEDTITQVPYIKDGLQLKNFKRGDWENFYKTHHTTIARQVNVEGKNWFGPIKSITFNVESPESQILREQELQIKNPTLGTIEITPDENIDLEHFFREAESIANQSEGVVKDIWRLFGILHPSLKIGDKQVRFSTTESKDFKGDYINGVVTINYNLIPDPQFTSEVLVHEIIHALTADWIELNPDNLLVKRLEGLLKEVPESVPEYNRRNVFELLSAISNPEIAKILKETKVKDKSLFQEFTDLLKEIFTKVFGLESLKNEPNLYDEITKTLIDIATNRPKQEEKGEVNSLGMRKRVVKNLPLGYDEQSVKSFLGDFKEDKTFLDNLVDSIDFDMGQYMYNKGLLADFIAGRLELDTVFDHLNNEYFEEVESKSKKLTPQEEKFYKAFSDENFDLVKEYWIAKTEFAKVKRVKVKENAQEKEYLEPPDEIGTNDPTEINNESEEKERELSAITGAEEVNEGRDIFERTGMDTSSLEAADPLVRVFVKMLPAVEKDKGITKIYQEDEIEDFTDFVQTPFGYIKLQRNQIGRIQKTDYYATWNKIADALADNLSLEEMMDKVENTRELIDVVPEIYVLRERLRQPIRNSFQAEVKAKVETAFKRSKVNIWILLKDKKGNWNMINESKDFVSVAKKKVNSAFLANLTRPELEPYYDRETGEFKIKEFLKTFNFERNGELQINLIEADEKILPLLGFEFHPKTMNNPYPVEEYRRFKVNLIKFLSNFDRIAVSIAEFVTRDQTVNNVKIQGLNNFFKKVYAIENQNNPLTVSVMVKNAENENQSSLSLFNTLLQTKLHYNRSKTETELNELVPRTRNSLFQYSLTKKILFKDGERTNREIWVENYNGVKQEQEGSKSEGSLLIDLSVSDKVIADFVGMVKEGMTENTRAETASTTYSFRLSDWGLNFSENKKTPFSIGEVQSVFDTKNKKVILDKSSPILQQWTDYLRAEIERSKQDKKSFGLLSDVFSAKEQEILLAGNTEDSITKNFELIRTNFENFFNNEIKDFKESFRAAGGYESILPTLETSRPDGKYDRELFNLIYPKDKNLSEEYLAFYTINFLTLHAEEALLFQGDISEFPKYFKRAKGVQSTGNPLSKSRELTQYLQTELNTLSFGVTLGNPLRVGDTFRSATLTDDIKPSHYYETGQFQQGYLESKKAYNEAAGLEYTEEELQKELELLAPMNSKGKREGYNAVNIGDGAAYSHPDFYFYLLSKVGSIDQNQIIGYKALVLDFKKNAKRYFPQFENTVLTEEEEKIRKEGLKLIEQGKVNFPIVKFTYRGNATNGTEQVIQKEMMDKFAIMPLFPQFIHNKPIATNLFLKMIEGNYGYVKFESGTKIGNFGTTDFIQEIEKGNIEVSLNNSSHSLQEEYLREQIKTPNKVKKENTFGSQFRKLIISGLKTVLGKPLKLEGEENTGDLVREWEQTNQQFSELTKKDVLGEFGITEEDGVWDYSNINYSKVADLLLREAQRRDLPDNLKIYFDKYKRGLTQSERENYYKHFEASFGSQSIQALIASIIKKISVQKLSGTQLVQGASSLFDRKIKVEGKTRELAFYRIVDSKVLPAECKVSMMGDFKKLLKLEKVTALLKLENLEDNELDRTHMLNKLLENDSFVEEYKDSLTIVGYRIPTQGFNSMNVMVIREFLPSYYGSTIITPPEITTQSGTDYDFDKQSVMFPSLNREGGLSAKGTRGVQNKLLEVSKKILLDKVNFHRLITPNSNDLIFPLLDEIFEQLGISTVDKKGTKVITHKTNLEQFNAVKGKGLLGIAAVWNPFYTLMQRHNWQLNPEYRKAVGFGSNISYVEVKINSVLNPDRKPIYFPLTKDNISKLELISQLINVTVDMPSDDKFGRTTLDKSDMGALIYSISILGYSFRDSLYFFHQPVIYNYKRLVKEKVRKGAKPYQAKILATYELLNLDLPIKKNGGVDWIKAEKTLYSTVLPNNERDLKADKIYSLTDVGQTSDVKVNQQQAAILSHYLLLQDQAEHLRTIQSAINFDTSPDSNLQKSFARQENYEKGVRSGIINKEKIDELFADSVTSGLHVSPILREVTTRLFPILYSQENQLMFSEVSENYRDKERAFRQIGNDFLLSIIQNFGRFNNRDVYDIAIQYLQGDRKLDLIKEAQQIQKRLNKEGFNLRLLDILVTNISKERQDKVFNPQIVMGFENSSDNKMRITEEWRELFKRPDTRAFAENLALVGMVQSGYSTSPIYYSDLIPEEFITPIVSGAIKVFDGLSSEQESEFRANLVTTFKNVRGRELGRKEPTLPKESYRLMDYRLPKGEEDILDIPTPIVVEVPKVEVPKTGQQSLSGYDEQSKNKSFATVESIKLKGSFRNKPVKFVDNIPTTKDKPVAMRNTGTEILIDEQLFRQKFEEKAWLSPATQSDGSKAKPLHKNEFKTFEEFLTFALVHEVKHDSIKKVPYETIGEYEDRINNSAIKDLNENYKDRVDPEDMETNTSTNPFEC